MESLKFYLGETTEENSNPMSISSEAVINMVGVILFYVVFFVAFNVFSG